jgi:hypothetical protein
MLALGMLAVSGCVEDSTGPPFGECRASITMHLLFAGGRYGFDATVANTGERGLLAVTIPYTVFFSGGGSDSREAYTPISLNPGGTRRMSLIITPPDSNPVNPRYIDIDDRTVDHVTYGEPNVRCGFS